MSWEAIAIIHEDDNGDSYPGGLSRGNKKGTDCGHNLKIELTGLTGGLQDSKWDMREKEDTFGDSEAFGWSK